MRKITLGNGPPPTIRYPSVESHYAGLISCIERSIHPLSEHGGRGCDCGGAQGRRVSDGTDVEADLEAVVIASVQRSASASQEG
jgi:hypothetical protein